MPLYEYKCVKCGHRFEELQTRRGDPSVIPCKKCGSDSNRQMSVFGLNVAGGSDNESVDMKIGREAGKRWQRYEDLRSDRHKGLKKVKLPRDADGKFQPIMGLGDTSEKKNRQEYVGALQEHRAERVKKGIPQFSEQGTF